jgi:hypothetical protein
MQIGYKNNIICVLIIKTTINQYEEFLTCKIMTICCNDVYVTSR